MVLVYHYTDEAGRDAIYRTNSIKASPSGAYGRGVYFTQLDPSTPRQQLAQNNWCTGDVSRTRFWFKFQTSDYPAIKDVSAGGSRNVWLHQGDMKLHTNCQVKLYHYTDRAGLEGIRASGIIRKHTPSSTARKDGSVDSKPAGVYFTELPPDGSTRSQRVRRVFGVAGRDDVAYGKTKYWFWFRVVDLHGVYKRPSDANRNEWVVEADVATSQGRR